MIGTTHLLFAYVTTLRWSREFVGSNTFLAGWSFAEATSCCLVMGRDTSDVPCVAAEAGVMDRTGWEHILQATCCWG
jgi:hypothetical protein